MGRMTVMRAWSIKETAMQNVTYVWPSWRSQSTTPSNMHNFCRGAMLCISAAYLWRPCRRVVSVRPSVHFTVCHVRVVCQNELSYLHFFHRRPFFCSYIPNPGNIPTETLTGASNAGGIWRKWEIAILDQYLYGFIACCQRCDRPVLYIWVLGTMWHAHLGPSQTQKMTS